MMKKAAILIIFILATAQTLTLSLLMDLINPIAWQRAAFTLIYLYIFLWGMCFAVGILKDRSTTWLLRLASLVYIITAIGVFVQRVALFAKWYYYFRL